MFSNFSDWLASKQKNQHLQHRQLFVISGEESWALQQAHLTLQELQLNTPLRVGHLADEQAVSQYRQYLGQEFPAVIYNGYAGLRANALASLSGVVTKGGLMILILPSDNPWLLSADPQIAKKLSYGAEPDDLPSYFSEWLINHIKYDPCVALLTPNSFKAAALPSPQLPEEAAKPYCHTEQKDAVAAIIKTVTGHRKRPLVLTADRGRGKSSSLGIATAQLFESGCKNILITAPTFATTEQVFKHAQLNLPGAEQHNQQLQLEGKLLEFVPIDKLLQELPKADLLMVDEAAAIPTYLLETLSVHYHRVVFSSTIHGYEGSGRGFEIRFKSYLDQNLPGWRKFHISAPVRWYQDDPLESFWFESLLLNAASSSGQYSTEQKLIFEALPSSTLLATPALLKEVFALLVNAHYQTTPDDLVKLLDAPEYQLFVLKQNHQILGVTLCCSEGGEVLTPLATEISAGKRRVSGHLGPQSLAFTYAEPKWVSQTMMRVVRIAIHPNCQNQGLGHYCLEQITDIGRQQNFDSVISSFGATGDLIRFWITADFCPIRLGLRKDASSGEHSALVIKSLSEKCKALLKQTERQFAQEWLQQLPLYYRDLKADVVVQLLKNQKNVEFSGGEYRSLVGFMDGSRPMESSYNSIRKLIINHISDTPLSTNQRSIAVMAVLQHYSSHELASKFSLAGKKAIEQELRQICQLIHDAAKITAPV